MKRELPIPPETQGDDRATEMIRVWLAHNDLHVSLNLGMWKDAEDSEVDDVIGRIKMYRLRSNQNVPPRRVRFSVLGSVFQVLKFGAGVACESPSLF